MEKIIYVVFSIVLLMTSCSKDEDVNTTPVILDTDKDGVIDSEDDCPNIGGLATLNGCPDEEEVWTVNRANQYALNIVFFKPTDFTADETLINEVSAMMLYIQKWYEKQMELQGFGKKTFGLITNQTGKVRVHLINGAQASTSYSGHSGIVNEIDQYFSENPDLKTAGAHTFVLGSRDSGVPFYGINKIAFATSENFELTSSGKFIEDLELKNCHLLGGIIHELGHGLNLPHCAHKKSDLPNISLMSFGNHTYQSGNENLVFLTKSDCAILDVNEAFNTKDKQYYNVNPTVTIEAYSVTKDAAKQATIVQGTFTSNIKATYFYVGHNGYPLEGGYDNITFTVPVTQTANANEYSFYVEMPYSDIFNGYQAKDILELSMVVITENGNKYIPVKYNYTIDVLSPEPNDDILKDYTPFVFSDRSSWTITANSTSPNTERVASKMIDSDYNTYWHSNYPYNITTSGAHEISINMNESKAINGVYLFSDRMGAQYRPKLVVVEISDDGITWTLTKEIDIATIGGAKEVYVNFDTTVTTKHIKILVSEIHAANAEENLIFSEVDIF